MSGQALEKYTLNVSGKYFTITRNLLQKYPGTRLADLTTSSEEYDCRNDEFYFDRNPKMMQNLLDLYRTDELHVPMTMCSISVKKELDFWGIDELMIADCCWKSFSTYRQDKQIQQILQDSFKGTPQEAFQKSLSLKQIIWLTMDNPQYSKFARIWNVIYFIFIAVAIVVFCLFNEPALRVEVYNNGTDNISSDMDDTTIGMLLYTLPNPYLYIIDNICLVFFTIEILVRLVVCPSKVKFIKEPLNILDVFLIIIMWIVFILDRFPEVTEGSSTIRQIETFLRLCFSVRVFRILHFVKRSKTMKLLILTFKASARELSFLMLGLGMAVLIFATLVFTAEMLLKAHTFDSIHNALWWALITMTTVGYGDYVPKSVPGQVVGSITAIIGLLILSLPIAIIASNFNTFITNLSAREHRLQAQNRDDQSKKVVENGHKNTTQVVSTVTRLELTSCET